jgi:hypothetical protein
MASKLEPLLWTRIARLNKAEWTGTFVAAHDDTLTPQNIKSGFRATGIYPFLPSKLLNQTPTPIPELTENQPLTPVPIVHFPQTVLTSSPMDLDAVQTANSTLSSLISTQTTIEPEPKEYFECHIGKVK